MSLTITRADVKRKCMIPSAETSLDDAIDDLIAEMQPAIEYTLDPDCLADTSDAALQALLQLGVLELISAELLAQRYREPGFSEELQVGSVRVGPAWERGKALFEQGSERLAPFRRHVGASESAALVLSAAPQERRFTSESMEGW